MITISIDVTLLDKSRFKTMTRKNGKQAVFAELVLIETPDGKYGDYMVKQSVTKEERAAKKEMPILGNGKSFSTGSRRPTSAPAESGNAAPADDDRGDDVPF